MENSNGHIIDKKIKKEIKKEKEDSFDSNGNLSSEECKERKSKSSKGTKHSKSKDGARSKKLLADVDIKEEVDEIPDSIMTDSWAQPIKHLWQHLPYDFRAEQEFNLRLSSKPPHCVICAVFKSLASYFDENNTENGHIKPIGRKGMKRGKNDQGGRALPMIPEMLFACSADNPRPLGFNTVLDHDGLSPLLTCDICKVTVHASCYGAVNTHAPQKKWQCTRCLKQKQDTYAECSLCCQRGGALKPTSDGLWAHIICALAIPEVKFENIQKREPINAYRITADRNKLRCQYCGPLQNSGKTFGSCVQCSHGRCTSSFHVTCAYAAGVQFETSDWPFPVYITCTRHCNREKRNRERKYVDVKKGDRVYAKHRNTRFYLVDVVNIDNQVFYSVDFDDGSFSNDLYPVDIHNHSPEDGPPRMGSPVKVKWTDGDLYGATFRGLRSEVTYTVRFEDGYEKSCDRSKIWAKDEELPKHIQQRLSIATERKYNFFYTEEVDKELEGSSKRPKPKISYSKLNG